MYSSSLYQVNVLSIVVEYGCVTPSCRTQRTAEVKRMPSRISMVVGAMCFSDSSVSDTFELEFAVAIAAPNAGLLSQ